MKDTSCCNNRWSSKWEYQPAPRPGRLMTWRGKIKRVSTLFSGWAQKSLLVARYADLTAFKRMVHLSYIKETSILYYGSEQRKWVTTSTWGSIDIHCQSSFEILALKHKFHHPAESIHPLNIWIWQCVQGNLCFKVNISNILRQVDLMSVAYSWKQL